MNRGRQGHWVQGKASIILQSSAVLLEWSLAPANARCASVVMTGPKHEIYPSTGRAGDGVPTSWGFTFRDASSSSSVHSPLFLLLPFLMREVKRAPNSAKGLVRMGVSWSADRQKGGFSLPCSPGNFLDCSHCDGDSCGRSARRQ